MTGTERCVLCGHFTRSNEGLRGAQGTLCLGCATLVHDSVAGSIPKEKSSGYEGQPCQQDHGPSSSAAGDLVTGLVMMGESEEAVRFAEMTLQQALSDRDWENAVLIIRTLLALETPPGLVEKVMRRCLTTSNTAAPAA